MKKLVTVTILFCLFAFEAVFALEKGLTNKAYASDGTEEGDIEEDEPSDDGKERLADAIDKGKITFYGVWKDNTLIGCCSITVVFSTFDYHSSGVFEDFYI